MLGENVGFERSERMESLRKREVVLGFWGGGKKRGDVGGIMGFVEGGFQRMFRFWESGKGVQGLVFEVEGARWRWRRVQRNQRHFWASFFSPGK